MKDKTEETAILKLFPDMIRIGDTYDLSDSIHIEFTDRGYEKGRRYISLKITKTENEAT